MATLEELTKLIAELRAEVKAVKEENTAFKKQLGMRTSLKLSSQQSAQCDENSMDFQTAEDGDGPSHNLCRLNVSHHRFFFHRHQISSFLQFVDKFVRNYAVLDMKTLTNGEMKVTVSTTEHYRSL